jgi:phosphoglycerate dehydrogenase-like enzyme
MKKETLQMSIILIAVPQEIITAEVRERIRELQPDLRLVVTESREEIAQIMDEIEIAAGHFPIEWITRAPRLRWFQQWGAGTDWLMRNEEAANKDFILTNASGVHAIPISEHILAMMLAFSRCLPQATRAQDRREWTREMGAFELAGKTMLLVGVGAIGRRTAQIASAMGIRVLGVRKNASREMPEIDQMLTPETMFEQLPNADFVVLTIPLTEETRNMFDSRAFEQMKPDSYIINIGRGGTIDEPALIAALQSGKIAGAGLDVFADEPLPEDSLLWQMDNVIITAHYSGETPHYDERAFHIFMDNLERYSKGAPMKNVVDKKRGY